MKIPATYSEFKALVDSAYSCDVNQAATELLDAGMNAETIRNFGAEYWLKVYGLESAGIKYDCHICGKPYGH